MTNDLLNETLDESYESFNQNNYFFARKRLVGMTSLCINCHTQLNKEKGILGSRTLALKESDFDTSFSYAEFLYLIRDYKKSIKFYKKTIRQRLAKNHELKKINKVMSFPEKDIRESLLRVISIYTKVNFEPTKAIGFLSGFENEKKFTKLLQEDVGKIG